VDGSTDTMALEVTGLNSWLDSKNGMRMVLREVELSISKGSVFALLGESGSGKTCLVHSILGLHPGVPGVVSGSARVFGREVFPTGAGFVRIRNEGSLRIQKDVAGWNRAMRQSWDPMLGTGVTLVPQDATTAISPFHNIGKLLGLAVTRGKPGLPWDKAVREGKEWLERVRMYDVDSVMKRYIHELSGGMAQRVAIALALAPGPQLMIADEPTTGLDATLRIELISLLATMVREGGVTLFLVTHDNGAARLLANDVAVLYDGMVVETGPVGKVLDLGYKIKHPYTHFLLETEKLLLEGAQIPWMKRETFDEGGCPYQTFCGLAQEVCRSGRPKLGSSTEPGHRLACWMKV